MVQSQLEKEQQMNCDICTRNTDELDYIYDLNTKSKSWVACEECATLLEAATKAISIARTDGAAHRYAEDYWRTDPRNNTEHALTHIFKDRQGDRSEDHIAHAICDLVIEYAKL